MSTGVPGWASPQRGSWLVWGVVATIVVAFILGVLAALLGG